MLERALVALLLGLLALPCGAEPVLHYLVLEQQVEPLQIASPGQPMAGGLVTELLLRLNHDGAVRIEPVQAPWLRLKAQLDRGELHDWVSYGWMDRPREDGECAPTPIADWRSVLVLPPERRLKEPIDLAALQGLRLLLVHGFDYPGLDAHLTSRGGTVKEHRALNTAGALRMLLIGRGDGVVEEQMRARYWQRRLGGEADDLRLLPLDAVLPPTRLCLMVDRRMAPATKALLFDRLAALSRSGELQRLVARYR